jgi:hypothetical protein
MRGFDVSQYLLMTHIASAKVPPTTQATIYYYLPSNLLLPTIYYCLFSTTFNWVTVSTLLPDLPPGEPIYYHHSAKYQHNPNPITSTLLLYNL